MKLLTLGIVMLIKSSISHVCFACLVIGLLPAAQKVGVAQELADINSIINSIKEPGRSRFYREFGQKWQIEMRLLCLPYNYQVSDADVVAWEALVLDDDADIYARLSAAVVLGDASMAAAELIDESLGSKNIRTRNNAAVALAIIVERELKRDGESKWKSQVVSLIQSRVLEKDPESGKWIREVSEELYEGDYPLQDRMDFLTPVPRLCFAVSLSRDEALIPLIVELLPDNFDKSVGLFRALGRIGTTGAGIELESFLGGPWIYKSGEVSLALADCGYTKAVPLIAKMLGNEVGRGGPMAVVESPAHRQGLLALLRLGDARAIPGIEAMIASRRYPFENPLARMVIARLKYDGQNDEADPMPGFVQQFRNATVDSEASMELAIFLGYCKERRALSALESATVDSKNFHAAGICVRAIHEIDGDDSTRSLVRLLNNSYPEWRKPENFVPDEGEEDHFLPIKTQLERMLFARTGQRFSAAEIDKWQGWADNHLSD